MWGGEYTIIENIDKKLNIGGKNIRKWLKILVLSSLSLSSLKRKSCLVFDLVISINERVCMLNFSTRTKYNLRKKIIIIQEIVAYN